MMTIPHTHMNAAYAQGFYSSAFGYSAYANANSTVILKAGSKRVETTGTNKIVLSALDGLDTVWTVSGSNPGFFVQPIRADGITRPLTYNPKTGEITYDPVRRRELAVDVEARVAALETRKSALEAELKTLAEKVQPLLP